MTGKQSAVLWIGLVIVALNLAMRWSQIKAIIFSSSPVSGSGGSGGSHGITVPIDPFLPTGPKITIPLAQQQGSTGSGQITVLLWPLQEQLKLAGTISS